jgi:hypothetical protein
MAAATPPINQLPHHRSLMSCWYPSCRSSFACNGKTTVRPPSWSSNFREWCYDTSVNINTEEKCLYLVYSIMVARGTWLVDLFTALLPRPGMQGVQVLASKMKLKKQTKNGNLTNRLFPEFV